MRRWGGGLGLVGLLVLVLAAGSATAAGKRKLVEGTVYDTTCASVCIPKCPPPPHCGPIPVQSRSAIVCAQDSGTRRIVCPLQASPRICLPSTDCGGYPVYAGEGAVVNVRRRGSTTVLATLPIVAGHFSIRLGPGEYVIHPYLPETQCWSASPLALRVAPKLRSPVPATLYVTDDCVAHPDGG